MSYGAGAQDLHNRSAYAIINVSMFRRTTPSSKPKRPHESQPAADVGVVIPEGIDWGARARPAVAAMNDHLDTGVDIEQRTAEIAAQNKAYLAQKKRQLLQLEGYVQGYVVVDKPIADAINKLGPQEAAANYAGMAGFNVWDAEAADQLEEDIIDVASRLREDGSAAEPCVLVLDMADPEPDSDGLLRWKTRMHETQLVGLLPVEFDDGPEDRPGEESESSHGRMVTAIGHAMLQSPGDPPGPM